MTKAKKQHSKNEGLDNFNSTILICKTVKEKKNKHRRQETWQKLEFLSLKPSLNYNTTYCSKYIKNHMRPKNYSSL